MLSLAKLRGGTGATYWLEQAQGRVTHADSVSSGVEDYYLAGPEAAGQWIGGGVAGLELGGEVEEVALTRLLDRQHPHTGEALPRPRRGRPPEVDGFDLMFSVPKSASVLFGLGDPRAQGAVVRAQRAAVEEAMRYLDREACLVRVGPRARAAARRRSGGGGVRAPHEPRRRSPAPHPRAGRQRDLPRRRRVGGAGRDGDLPPCAGGRSHPRGGVSAGAGARARGGVGEGAQRHRRHQRLLRPSSCGRSRPGPGRSTPTWPSTAGAAPRRGRSPRCARARPRTTT